jgi:hypothetical protein
MKTTNSIGLVLVLLLSLACQKSKNYAMPKPNKVPNTSTFSENETLQLTEIGLVDF